jgi:hypothetical protein
MEKIDSLTIKGLIFAGLTFLNITPEVAGYLLTVIFFDSFLGVLKSLKIGIKFSFNRLTLGMLSKFSLLLIPFLIAFFGLAFGHNLVYVVDAFIYIIAANETVAIISKIGTLRTGKEYKNEDFIAIAIDILRLSIMDKIEALKNAFLKK